MWARHTLEGRPLEEAIAAPRLHVEAQHDPALVLCEPGLDVDLLEPGLELRRFTAPDMFFGGIKSGGEGG